ncbi:EEF1A lysine methyltransferase 4-like [Passer domesticus]|uniref:EEF1A lysine methyltransferase 4-like n=1 Tax=Passer domesticus TaxID=48849 RepID=UPI0030FEC3A0
MGTPVPDCPTLWVVWGQIRPGVSLEGVKGRTRDLGGRDGKGREGSPWEGSRSSEPHCGVLLGLLLPQVSRVLRPGGCFISITFAQPHFRKPHYAQEAFGWSLRHAACGDGDGALHYFLYTMRKGQPLDPRDAALGRRLHQPPPAPAPPPPPAPPDDDEDYLLAIQL